MPPVRAGPGRTIWTWRRRCSAGLAKARAARQAAELVFGAGALSSVDRRYLALEQAFETILLDQGRSENRGLDDTFDRAWRVLATLPRRELTMLPSRLLDARYPAVQP